MSDMAMNAEKPRLIEAQVSDYFALMKPKVMSLVVLTAAVAMFAAPGGIHPIIAIATILCIAVGAGASGALNMWWDADIDAVMKRTSTRPVAAGVVEPEEALGIGVGLAIMSVLMLSIFGNLFSAAFLAFTIFFYVVVYSMWLKRWTPYNIVIGGAAGAFPPMIGWAVATGGVSLESVLMFALIFLWTPPHFWALAIFRNEDYVKAGVPMLPVVAGDRATRNQILAYTLILFPVAMVLAFTPIGGPVYFAVAFVYNARFVWGAWAIWKRDEASAKSDKFKTELRVFLESIGYLFALFIALGIEIVLRALDLNWSGWPVFF